MKIHFLNVGHGDCTIIEHDSGKISVIDINASGDIDDLSKTELLTGELSTSDKRFTPTNPFEYLESIIKPKKIFRFILTHPHMDHMRGIGDLFETYKISCWWDTVCENTPKLSDDDKYDWDYYVKLREAKGNRRVYNYGDSYNYFCASEDNIKILYPTKSSKSIAGENTNNYSYVLKVGSPFGGIILGGDAESAVWDDILSRCPEELDGCIVLKASHHGRDSGFHKEAVKRIAPVVTIVSVGKKPDTDASAKYNEHSKYLYSTRWHGNTVIDLNSEKWTISTEY